MYCEAVEIFHIPFYPTAVSMVMEGTDAKPATAFWKTTNGIGGQVSTRALLEEPWPPAPIWQRRANEVLPLPNHALLLFSLTHRPDFPKNREMNPTKISATSPNVNDPDIVSSKTVPAALPRGMVAKA